MTAANAGGASGSSRGGRGMWLGALLLVVAVLVVVIAGSRHSDEVAFGVGSPAPDGYKALSILLRERGAQVRSSSPASLLDPGSSPGDVVVVADPDLLTAPEHRALLDRAQAGALVVLGAPRRSDKIDEPDDPSAGGFGFVPARVLADTPARPAAQGSCDIDRLDGLRSIDTAFAEPVEPAAMGSEARRCYGDIQGAFVVEARHGAGSVITLGSPYLWANARLQPSKEDGGEPLDNAAMALRLLGPTAAGAAPGVRIAFVDAVPTAGVAPNGSRSPLDLMPTGVKLALAQLIAAFVLYAWWRARRLGPVVTEKMPVEIAGSELIVAVGDLLRRKGTPQRAADVLRADARRDLSRRLGVPIDATPSALVAVVSARSGLEADHVLAVLADGPIDSPEALVRLANALSDIRQEVLDHHVSR